MGSFQVAAWFRVVVAVLPSDPPPHRLLYSLML